MYGTRGRSRLHCACPAFSVPASTSGRCEAWIARYPYTYADSRLVRALIFSAASELGVRHSSATIPLRVSLFLFEMPSAATPTSFSYRSLARTRRGDLCSAPYFGVCSAPAVRGGSAPQPQSKRRREKRATRLALTSDPVERSTKPSSSS